MRGNIISYIEMCRKEGTSLQKGMNFRLKATSSVILMSVRKNAPYRDEVIEDGTVLIYEGHDEPKIKGVENPKLLDQPEFRQNGTLTENGKFYQAAQSFKTGKGAAEIVQVYEKIKAGIWSDNGYFHLIDAWKENDSQRNVFKFKVDEPPVQLNMLNLGLSVILLRVAEVVAKRKCGNRDMGAVARIGDPFNEGKPSSGSRP